MTNKPPKRKNGLELISERKFIQSGKEYLRRDYEDGTVDLITYNAERGFWLFETYSKKTILESGFDFEYCLSDLLLCGLCFVSASVVPDRRNRK